MMMFLPKPTQIQAGPFPPFFYLKVKENFLCAQEKKQYLLVNLSHTYA